MHIQAPIRKIVLVELILPIVLLILGIYHGLLQTLYRAGYIHAASLLGLNYYQGLTAHGVINAVVLTTFFAVAYGHVIISSSLRTPLHIGLATSGFMLLLLGTLMAAGTILAGQASVLYTFYPPLKAHPIFYLGLALFVVGSWLSYYSWIPPYLTWRKENPATKVPLNVVGIFSTFIVWQIATVPVAVEVLFMLFPWSMGWVPEINIVLARTLFWFFGHPLVYFWLLPTYVMYYTVLPKLAGGKLFSDFAGRFAFLLFCVLSAPLGFHHQFSEPGIGVNWKALHTILTSFVAIPSMMTAFTIAASLEYGAKSSGGKGLFRWWGKLPYWDANRWLFPYLFCGLFIFIFGGVTGIINASFSMNNVVHNTAWIPAHFHLTVGGPVFLGILGMSLYLVSGLLGVDIRNKKLALWVPYLWTLGVSIFSTGLFIGGLKGEPRRTNMGLSYVDPTSTGFRPEWLNSSAVGVLGGIIMTLSVCIFFFVFFRVVLGKKNPAAIPSFELIESEAYHDEDIGFVKNFRPWIYAAIVAVLISYSIPLYNIFTSKDIRGATPFAPDSPVSQVSPP